MAQGYESLSGNPVYALGTSRVLNSDQYSSGSSSFQHAIVCNLNDTYSVTTKLLKVELFGSEESVCSVLDYSSVSGICL